MSSHKNSNIHLMKKRLRHTFRGTSASEVGVGTMSQALKSCSTSWLPGRDDSLQSHERAYILQMIQAVLTSSTTSFSALPSASAVAPQLATSMGSSSTPLIGPCKSMPRTSSPSPTSCTSSARPSSKIKIFSRIGSSVSRG